MAVSITDVYSRTGTAPAGSEDVVRATVTGVDVKGQMFRRPAIILLMDGRDCRFRSDHQPESGGSVLIEFDYNRAGAKRFVLHATVRSTEVDAATGSCTAIVELEVTQTEKIRFRPVEAQPLSTKSSPSTTSSAAIQSAPGTGVPITTARDISSSPPSNGGRQVVPGPNHESHGKVNGEIRETPPKPQIENPFAIREAVKSAVAAEIKQEITVLKTWISGELQKTLPGIVSSNVEKMIREAVEKQTAANHEVSIQALNAGVARQIEERLAKFRITLDASAKKLVDEKTDHSRTTGDHVTPELSSHAAAIMRSFEESSAAMAEKISNEQSDLSRATLEQLEQELSSHAAAIMRSFEDSTAEMAKKLVDDQMELSQNTGDRVEQELSSRSDAILRSFEQSATELTKKLADEQVELSRNVHELSSHAAAIMRSFEDSTAEMAKKLADEQAQVSRNAGDRVEQELSSRADTIVRSFEESTAEIARKLLDEQSSLSRSAGENAERELSSRAAAIVRSLEESTAEIEGRIYVSRAATEEALTRSQSLHKEISDGMLPLQQALQQLNDASRDGIEKLQSQAVSEINRRAAQFEDRLGTISSERAIGFAAEIEGRLAPSQQQADELLERIGAVFQLLQSTARVQHERLTEHSKAVAANFEEQIRSVLLRFAGGSQH